MGKRAAKKNIGLRVAGSFGAAGLVGASFVAMTSPAMATTCEDVSGATVVSLGSGTICQVTFSSSGTFTIPTGITNLSAVLVGGGSGSANRFDGSAQDRISAGAGGSVVFVDLSSQGSGTTLSVVVGDGGDDLYSEDSGTGYDGGNSEIRLSGTPIEIAPGGQAANVSSDMSALTVTQMSSNFTGQVCTDGTSASGSGAGGNGTNCQGGPGLAISSLSLGSFSTLWGTDPIATQFGPGGTISATMQGSIAGAGANATAEVLGTSSAVVESGKPGVVIIRYATGELGGSSPAPASVPYEGPMNLRQQASNPCAGGSAFAVGERLDSIKNVYVNGAEVSFEVVDSTRLKYSVPQLALGRYQIKFWVPINNVNLTDVINIGACAAAPEVPGAEAGADGNSDELTPFYATKLFASYQGDRGAVIARDRNAITQFISKYEGIQRVTCVGRTSGMPAIETDEALARARANNACSVIAALAPNAKITLKTATGLGVGQQFRSVVVYISGKN